MMEIVWRGRTLALAVVICSGLFVIPSTGKAQQKADAQTSEANESLKSFLKTLDDDKTTRYALAFRDLNADGTPEAIVYLVGNRWCGSGGCNTLILTPERSSWRIVGNIRITRPPIRVLKSTSHGWRDVSVWVQGGGTQSGYEAELRFNGKAYPSNPSVPPAERLEKPKGEVVITEEQGERQNATPLYDDQATAPTR
jgi:hypothetical protein